MQLQAWLDDIANRMRQESFSKYSIQRLTRELADHYRDIMEENPMSNVTQAEIVQRLGSSESILIAANSHRKDARPWFYFLAVPFFGTLGCVIVTTFVVALAMGASGYMLAAIFEGLGVPKNALERSMIVEIGAQMIWSIVPVLSVILASAIAFRIIARRDNKTVWSVLAFAIIAFLAAPMQYGISWESRNMYAGMSFESNLSWFVDGFRLAQIAIPMIALALFLRQRRTIGNDREALCA